MNLGYPISYIDVESLEKDPIFANIENLEIVVNKSSKMYIDLKNRVFCYKNTEKGFREFVEIVYEKVPEILIDYDKAALRSDIAIHIPHMESVIYVKKGAKISVIEASGRNIVPLVRSGDRVGVGDKVMYKVTRKYEVRVLRSYTNGVVLYVGNVFSEGEEKTVILIVGEEDVLRLSRCSG